ncbi:PaaI family thioesterase [Streptomyces sp. SID6673]|nr:PaaI family thioesterase [Streptomyces sp. SID11726]NEB23908.1 PaaI family thioesterase [Streptomyces sp. SID6673]NED62376.1 PaaI family thioesterase [Streptomyces sp. SID10244]
MTDSTSIRHLFDQIGFGAAYRDGDELVVELPVAPHVVNTKGGIQGGLIATLIDVVAGQHVISGRTANSGVVTSDMNIRYLRPITTGIARARARTVHSGRRSVIVQVDVYGTDPAELAVVATVNFANVVNTTA